MEEKILKVIEDVNEDIIGYNGENLFDDGIIDSFSVINLVAELEEAFEIDIDAKYVVEDNFKTKEAIVQLVLSLLK